MMTYLLVIVGTLLVLALWLRWREPSMIFYPDRGITITPDKLGQRYEDVWLTTADGIRINGWFLPAHVAAAVPGGASAAGVGAAVPSGNSAAETAATTTSALTILFLHGNAGNISHRYEKFDIFRDLGADVFIIDYRGYGRSEGRPDEAGTYLDAQAAYEYLVGTDRRAVRTENGAPGGRALPARTVVVYGESLGAAVAVDLASKVPVGGLVIEEAFTSVADVGQKMFPFLPVRWLVRNKYDSLSKIGRVNAPLLILHSRDDEYFPMRHAERLLAAAREPKTLVALRGSHNDAFLTSAETYREALHEFLRSL